MTTGFLACYFSLSPFGLRSAIRSRDISSNLSSLYEGYNTALRGAAGLLGDPCPGRVRRGAHDVDGPARVLDEEHHVDSPEEHRADMEQITDPDAPGLA